MLPESNHCPTGLSQRIIDITVSLNVRLDFPEPELSICLQLMFLGPPTVTVPEVTVAEHCHSLSDECEVGSSQDSGLLRWPEG